MKRRLAVLALLLVLLGAATPALAHALLLRSVPEANAAVDRAPAQVELYFSESLDNSFSKITVLDSTGKAVDGGDSKVDPADETHLTVSLPSLPDGVYTVSWKALSATDGHVTTGSFPFAIGNVDAAQLAAAAQAGRQVKLSLAQVIANWLEYLGVAMLVGGTFFILVAWQPAYQAVSRQTTSADAKPPPWERLAAGAVALFVLANILALLVEAGQVSGAEIAPPWSSALAAVIFQTRYGTFWLARVTLAIALAALLLQSPAPRRRWLAIAVGLLLLLLISLGSHAAAEPKPLIPTLVDWLHITAASVWVGGLSHFAFGLWVSRHDRNSAGQPLASRLASVLLPRFSSVALISVATLGLTGLYQAIVRLGSFDLLFGTLYGQTLIVKVLLALPMVGMGAVNLLWTTPNMKRAASAAADAPVAPFFRRFVTSEVALGLAVLLSVALLTNLPPARTTATAPTLHAKNTVDDLALEISIDPGRIGLNTFTLNVSSGGQPVIGAKQVALRFTPTVANLAPSQAVLQDKGNGQYSIRGAYFSLPDTWQVQAVVRRDGKFDSFANFNFPLGATATAAASPWHRVNGGLLLVAAVLLFVAIGRVPLKAHRLGPAAAWASALALCAAGLVVYYQAPPGPAVGPVNPIPPNADSVAIGQQLYLANCVPCHGLSGKGDGPVGLTLNPRPADLSLHAIPGVHTDGQMFEWISNGFPGSVMPSFKTVFTEDQRWHLLNYVRTLAPH